MFQESDLPAIADDIARYAKDKFPSLELHELGAILMSAGIFLTSNAIPDLWPRLRGTAELSHQLLLNNGTTQRRDDRESPTNRTGD